VRVGPSLKLERDSHSRADRALKFLSGCSKDIGQAVCKTFDEEGFDRFGKSDLNLSLVQRGADAKRRGGIRGRGVMNPVIVQGNKKWSVGVLFAAGYGGGVIRLFEHGSDVFKKFSQLFDGVNFYHKSYKFTGSTGSTGSTRSTGERRHLEENRRCAEVLPDQERKSCRDQGKLSQFVFGDAAEQGA